MAAHQFDKEDKKKKIPKLNHLTLRNNQPKTAYNIYYIKVKCFRGHAVELISESSALRHQAKPQDHERAGPARGMVCLFTSQLMLVPNYTAWWHKQMYMNDLPTVVLEWGADLGFQLVTSRSKRSNALTILPQIDHCSNLCQLVSEQSGKNNGYWTSDERAMECDIQADLFSGRSRRDGRNERQAVHVHGRRLLRHVGGRVPVASDTGRCSDRQTRLRQLSRAAGQCTSTVLRFLRC